MTDQPVARSLVIDNIGSLVTNDPALGRGPLGIVERACVVIVDDVVEHVGPAGAIADTRIDADGACVLPGFVDSHTHLVFAGDRAEEFTARMAGRPYDGGGIRVTTDATRSTATDELDRLVRRRLHEAHHAGTTTIEIKSGYGLNVVDEARSVGIARTHTSESTFLGAHLLPAEFEGIFQDVPGYAGTTRLTANGATLRLSGRVRPDARPRVEQEMRRRVAGQLAAADIHLIRPGYATTPRP